MKSISISDELIVRLQHVAARRGSGVRVDDVAAELLAKALETEERGMYSAHDEEKIKKRLQALGYLE